MLGKNAEVCAYSNASTSYISEEDNFIENNYTGLKWQCIEYARRWLYQTNNLSFCLINFAYEIWTDIHYCYNPATKKQTAFLNHANGSSTVPRTGDLLVYAKTFLQTGHVAVIVEINIEQKWLRLAEQNYHNKIWPAHYSRQIDLNIIKKNNQSIIYSLDDSHILGWKSLAI